MIGRTGNRLLLVALFVTAAGLACNIPEWATPQPTADPSMVWTQTASQTTPVEEFTQTAGYQPRFEPTDCRFDVPDGYSPQCGDLIVPEDRTDPHSPSIRLHVAIFPSTVDNPAPDPVIHLAGGPGSSSFGLLNYYFSEGFDAILSRRDYIIFDQRGVGYSWPTLNCPERDEIAPELLEQGLGSEQAYTLETEAFNRCHERLIGEGRILTAYTSAASAADVNDLRIALGYEQVNLYAVSYGTRLALTVLRDYPQGIRSVILDSAYPPQVNLYTALAPNAERAFNALFDACATDTFCSTTYPDLRNVFYASVDDLNINPVMVTATDPETGVSHEVKVTGGLLIDVLFVGLYNDEVLVTMPSMIYSVRAGDYSYLARRLQLYFGHSSSRGMGIAVQCNEEVPFSTYEDQLAAAVGVQPQIAEFYSTNIRYLYATCPVWNPFPPDPVENQPVSSAVPTLILAGRFDPITPPEWGYLAAETLSRSFIYEFPHAGHWVMRAGPCGLSMVLAFLDDPTIAPDSSCLARLGGPEFR